MRAAWAVAAGKAAVLLATSGVWGFHRDEFYYWAGGQRLDWGYVDHPPLTPFLYRVGDALFGPTELGLRVVPALIAGAVVVLAAVLARELGAGPTGQAIAALVVATAPMFLTIGHFLGTVSFEVLAFAAASILVVRLLRTEDARLWPAIGAVAGIGLLNKHSMTFWAIAVTIGMLLTPARRHLRTWWLPAGLAVALVIALPHLVWQMAHGWPTTEFLASLRSRNLAEGELIMFLPLQLILLSPLGILVWLPGLLWLLRAEAGRRYRSLGIAFVALAAMLWLSAGKAYYLGPMYPVLIAAGAVALETASTTRRRRTVVAVAVFGLLAAPFAFPVVPASWLDTIPMHEANEELGEMIGWRDMAEQVAAVHAALPADERADVTIFTSNYSEAGAIEMWAEELGLPPPISGHNSYWMWGPGQPADGPVVLVGLHAHARDRWFAGCRVVTTITNAHRIENDEFGAPVSVCDRPVKPWPDLWPEVKHFD